MPQTPSTLHVAVTGSDAAHGTPDAPLRTISEAARRAQPGDTVLVHEGEYREWVRPARGGLGEHRRITYAAAPGEHVVVKGSERIEDWERVDAGTWRVTLPNAYFGEFNPYAREIDGDWLIPTPGEGRKHLGEVYLDGVSLFEVASPDLVGAPQRRTHDIDAWTGASVRVADPDATTRVWHARVDEHETTIWINVGDVDPNAVLTEINVRRSVFYPEVHHVDYVTVRGFELAHAACPWAPPTGDQPGLVGPNWAKGWIIEDNDIHDAKGSAVSLGKEASTGDNFATLRGDKPGYQYQLESVFAATRIGWDKETIGSHVVRRNRIHHCGQNAVVGHLGCVFSTIEDNHIHDIATKREYFGHEIAGIKLHAAIDVTIAHNRIHDCTLGLWLDWQTQGTRVTRNAFYRNDRDLFVEVSHGPYVVDHNVFASAASIENVSQGGAYLHNLVAGTYRLETVPDRATPYHVPHSTDVAGYAVIEGGDDRLVGNLFLGDDSTSPYAADRGWRTWGPTDVRIGHGTAGYDDGPASLQEYLERVNAGKPGDHQKFLGRLQPAYVRDNVYAGAARPFRDEDGATLLDGSASCEVVEDGEQVYLVTDLPAGFDAVTVPPVGGADLPPVRFAYAEFENRDGSPLTADVDLVGQRRSADAPGAAGCVAALRSGTGRVRIW
ncbi:right-handed parallel beta-helix repeat-containing protein [Agilicoccus flavus]|uniref:right-handed parallel beta-helix repeat-containing protein n=1 Tax=Agilicoccus flavus TaxID=2775968 RepID=UPI001CF6BD33|nr:right-handed parallel beta-helix repeat-containing protein [Agilicoccus flavus]